MGVGINSEKFAVQHMAQSCQGVPVATQGLGKRPDYGAFGDTCLYVGVLGDVTDIIKIDKIALKNISETSQGKYRQGYIYQKYIYSSGLVIFHPAAFPAHNMQLQTHDSIGPLSPHGKA